MILPVLLLLKTKQELAAWRRARAVERNIVPANKAFAQQLQRIESWNSNALPDYSQEAANLSISMVVHGKV